ncbi:MAG: hypothetical protein H8E66_02215 [Planctomycetes bacterium]|nr:hypothetical protein [Planctomycetota bacterium]
MLLAIIGILYFLIVVCGIASLVFFIMVVIQMFKRDETNMGIICIVLAFCTGVGPLVAFVYGWIKATEWDIKKIMTYWSAAIAAQLVLVVLVMVCAFAAAASIDPNQFNMDQDGMDIEFDFDEADFQMPDDFTIPEAIPVEEE